MSVADVLPTGVPPEQEEEELEDVPEAEKAKDPLRNAVVIKNGFKGRVEEIERGSISKDNLYRVRYDDGDLEHFTGQEVVQYRSADGPSAAKAKGKVRSGKAPVESAPAQTGPLA